MKDFTLQYDFLKKSSIKLLNKHLKFSYVCQLTNNRFVKFIIILLKAVMYIHYIGAYKTNTPQLQSKVI